MVLLASRRVEPGLGPAALLRCAGLAGARRLIRRLEIAASLGHIDLVGGLAALGMLYVLFRNVYPVPAAPYSSLPWIFLAVLVAAALWYAVVRSRGGVVDVAAAERAEAQAESRDS